MQTNATHIEILLCLQKIMHDAANRFLGDPRLTEQERREQFLEYLDTKFDLAIHRERERVDEGVQHGGGRQTASELRDLHATAGGTSAPASAHEAMWLKRMAAAYPDPRFFDYNPAQGGRPVTDFVGTAVPPPGRREDSTRGNVDRCTSCGKGVVEGGGLAVTSGGDILCAMCHTGVETTDAGRGCSLSSNYAGGDHEAGAHGDCNDGLPSDTQPDRVVDASEAAGQAQVDGAGGVEGVRDLTVADLHEVERWEQRTEYHHGDPRPHYYAYNPATRERKELPTPAGRTMHWGVYRGETEPRQVRLTPSEPRQDEGADR